MPYAELVEFVQHYGLIAAGISAIGSVILIIIRKGIMPALRAFKKYNELCQRVEFIFNEVKTNGGTSIKDKINRIDAEMLLMRERLRAVMHDAQDPYFEADLEGNFTWVNRAFTRLVAMTPTELIGHGWENTVLQEDRIDFVADWYLAAEQQREFSMSMRFETANGEIIPARVRSYKMTDSVTGETLGFLGRVSLNEDSQ